MGSSHSYPDSRIVHTNYGAVQGRRLVHEGEKQVDAFQGIPFAKPPVGELRFKKPEAPDKWDGIRKTTAFAKRAPQDFMFTRYFKWMSSEDCLYLNVFTPCWTAPEEGFPVMVFIHGGAFSFGDAITYGDRNICEHIVTRDVIFVTIQYRLGYLGFFTTGDDECPPNLGLWDMTAALRWVNENIEAFGGNRNNITLVGHSAGAVGVDMLHLSPHSTGLFHKMLAIAGNVEVRPTSHENLLEHCRNKAARLGVKDYSNSKELLDKLRRVPAISLAPNMISPEKNDDCDFETVPYHDGVFFPAPFDDLRKTAVPKPLLTGVTKEEGLLFLLGKKPSEKTLNEVIALTTRDAKDKEEMEAELRSLYLPGGVPDNKEELMRAIANIASDYYFTSPTLEFCRKTVANQAEPVYLYVFEHCNPTAMGLLRWLMPIQDTTHGSELFYFFHAGVFGSPTVTEADRVVAESFTTAFTNFAKYGNPNGPVPTAACEWLPIDRKNAGRNYVFAYPNNRLDEEYFKGRSAKYAEIVRRHRVQ